MARVEPVDNNYFPDAGGGAGAGAGGGSGASAAIADKNRRKHNANKSNAFAISPSEHSVLDRLSAPGAFIFRARHVIREMFVRSGWHESAIAVRIRKFLRGRCFAAVAAISLFTALFLGDIFALGQVATNTTLDVILMVVFAIFALEFLGLALTDPSYLFGFFFWMDLLGTGSMIFDISFLAGQDVSEPDIYTASGGSDRSNVVVVRATRAAKLGARAGRISRVLKILRFLPFLLKSDQNDQVKMARVISNQLTNALSTRVAFLTICIVVITPLFTMFTYPEEDDSMSAWTELLALDAERYHAAFEAGNATAIEAARLLFVGELERLRSFYAPLTYGPFRVIYGQTSANGGFVPLADELDLGDVGWTFEDPSRKSSIRIITQHHVQTHFNLSGPMVAEAGASLGLILFIILVMCVFGLIVSSSISVIALQPLERMLSVVRERCTQIFKYTDNLKEDGSDDESQGSEDYDDMQHDSEFVLLEKVVGKLAAIASLSVAKEQPEVTDDLNENELLVLNWTQGAHLPSSHSTAGSRTTIFPKGGPNGSRGGSASASGKDSLGLGLSSISQSVAEEPGTIRTDSLGVIPIEMMESLETADFNPLDLASDVRIAAGQYLIMSTSGPWASWARSNVTKPTLCGFVSQVEASYKDNPFHNFAHALDVEYTVYRFITLLSADRFMSETMQFCMLIAALGHDIGHMAVNNQYLIEVADELAVKYNDRSPLENMHCARLFQIASGPDANLFAQLGKEMYKEMRKSIIDAILHTDVTKHNEMIKDCGLLYQVNSEAFDSLNPSDAIASQSQVQLIASMFLHGADVSNPMKPWELCKRYAYLCMEEFFAQGDLEKQAGIPVQMLNDREKVSRPNSQIGFIEFFIAPMVAEMVHLFPQLHTYATNLGQNIENWSEVWQNEASPSPEVVAKVAVRVRKVADSMGSLAAMAKEHQSAANQ